MRGLAVAAVAALLLAGCAEDAAPPAESGPAADPQPFLVSIPVDVRLSMGPEGGCILQGDQPPVVSTCEASPEVESYDLLPNQTLVAAHLVLDTGGVIPNGSEPVLRLGCRRVEEPCPAPLAEVHGATPLALDWEGTAPDAGLRIDVEPFLRGETAVAAWYPIVATATVTGELVVRQGPPLPTTLVPVVEPIDFTGTTPPCVEPEETYVCGYPDGRYLTMGPYEQPIEEIHVLAEWTAVDASTEQLTLVIRCRQSDPLDCDAFERIELRGPSPLAVDLVDIRVPVDGRLYLSLREDEIALGQDAPFAQEYHLSGFLVHLGDPDGQHQS